MRTALGGVFIALQKAEGQLQFESDQEREEFFEDWGNALGIHLRQKLLTWRAGRKCVDIDTRVC